MKTKSILLVFMMVLSGLSGLWAQSATTYRIVFETVPRLGFGRDTIDFISGRVIGPSVPNLSTLRIILYARGGAQWWIQPTVEDPITRISKNGTWQNETHLGIKYGALLVDSTYKPSRLPLDKLPQPDRLIRAVVTVDATRR